MSSTRETELVPAPERSGHDAVPTGAAPGRPGAGPSRRRFWWNALALLLILLAVSTVLDNGYPAISDEGAVLAQLEHLDSRPLFAAPSWRIDRPFAELDPSGTFTPLENSEVIVGQYLPYAKHAAYPALLLPVWRVLGHHGAIALSAVAVWLAALAAAVITRRLRPELELPALWLLGLGSPLLFDSTVVMAHALAAAALGFLVVCLLRQVERPNVLAGVGALGCAAVLVSVRSEGLFAVAAAAAVCASMSVQSLRPVRIRLSTLALAVAVGASGLAAYLLDGRVAATLVGRGGSRGVTILTSSDLLGSRVSAGWVSLLRPGSLGSGWPPAAGFMCLVLMAAAGVMLRFLPARRSLAVWCLVGAAVLAVLRQLAPTDLVSGLLPAFPLLVLGLLFLRLTDLRRPAVQLCLGISVLSAMAIWLTSYSVGGGVEWGGRYFHLLLPLLVPLVVVGLDRARRSIPAASPDAASTAAQPGPTPRPWRSQRTIAVVSVLVVTASSSWSSLRSVDDLRRASEVVVPAALAAADAAEAPTDGGPPVLITDAQPLGRSAWDSLDDHRLVRVPVDTPLAPLLDDLADTDIGTVTVLVSPLQELPDSALDRWSVVAERELEGWNITFVELHER